ncbi:heptaprenyl diphosphate synthase [Hydrogenispora ethanolica]|uniref:Heptaprenyl diphosphate synthase n=1 Tax=Hydrogenispora ethanolica TaxID=1082276 RepID=A0A4R1S064_HYDET|nr:polyprenyl synthetase family protein [Hydrogenispora ethanolica]TCL71662.1 heptaprenyl diphosphate synthase [Hydrogenispora ethanolica]
MQAIQKNQVFQGDFQMELERVESLLREQFVANEGILGQIGLDAIAAGGKRFRPKLVIQCGKIFGPADESLIAAAAAFELLHLASLIHDDVLDRAAVRRNRPALYRQWGSRLAVLTGDYLLAAAFQILSANCPPAVLRLAAQSIQRMCRGEFNQAEQCYDPSVRREQYYRRIADKTGSLMENCCRAGALLGGAGPDQAELAAAFGRETGYAYQIIDDILDIAGAETVTGKPVGEDFRQGILTLPTLLLLEEPEHGEWLRSRLEAGKAAGPCRRELRRRLNQAGALAASRRIAAEHLHRARTALSGLPDTEATRLLERLTDQLASGIEASSSKDIPGDPN